MKELWKRQKYKNKIKSFTEDHGYKVFKTMDQNLDVIKVCKPPGRFTGPLKVPRAAICYMPNWPAAKRLMSGSDAFPNQVVEMFVWTAQSMGVTVHTKECLILSVAF